jgi:hypothetical protein
MIRLHAHLLPPFSVSKLSFFLSLPFNRSSFLRGQGVEGVGVKPNPYDSEKAYASINNLILSGRQPGGRLQYEVYM